MASLHSPFTYNSLWGTKPPLPWFSWDNTLISYISCPGRVPWYFSSPHWSLRLHKYPSLRSLSCVIATIRGSVIFSSRIQPFVTKYGVVLIFLYFIQNGRLFSISQKCSPSNRNFKNKNSRTFWPSVATLFCS